MNNKASHTKKLRTLCIVLCSLILAGIIYFPPTLNMKLDDDQNFYTSYSTGYIAPSNYCFYHMSYNNGKLIANNTYCTTAKIYDDKNIDKIKLRGCSQIVDDYMVYMDNTALYYENLKTNKKTLICNNCENFFFDGINIVYAYKNTVTAVTTRNLHNAKSFDVEGNLIYYNVNNDKLYITTRLDHDYISKHNFYILDIDTMTMLDFSCVSMSGAPDDMIIYKGDFLFHHNDSNAIFKVDFENSDLIRLLEHESIVDLATNGDKVYFVAEKTDWKLITYTVYADTNGIWEFDVTSGNIKKLSNDCVIDDLLVTDNYIYCYTKKYFAFRGTADMCVVGYKLKQIPIKQQL